MGIPVKTTLLTIRVLAILALLFAGPAFAQTTSFSAISPPGVGHPPAMQLGSPRALFRANCSTCHGDAGFGGTSWIEPTAIAPPIAGYNPFSVVGHVRAGHPPAMPAFPPQAISDEDLARLALFVSQLPTAYRPPPTAVATVQILDEDPWFSPPQVAVQAWETVRFINAGSTYHPVVELDWLMSGGKHGINSGPLGPGGEFYLRFAQPGVKTLLCGIHPYMKAEVHVGGTFTPPSYSVHSPGPLPAVPGVGEIWICAQFQDWPGKAKDGVVQVIDAATWTVTDLIPVGNNPHNIWFGAGSSEAVVTNWFDATVSRIDVASRTVTGTCVVGASPAHITSDWSGNYWYVTMEGTNHVRRFTQGPGPWSLCGSGGYPQLSVLSGYGPHGVWYSSGKIVSANSLDSTFSIIDAATLTETALLPTGFYPLGASASRDGKLAASGNGMGMSVSFYDLVGEQHIRDVMIGTSAIQVPFTPDSRYVVAAGGSYVTVIDAWKAADPIGYPNAAAAIVAQIWTGDGAHGVAFGRNTVGGRYAYVTHKFENYFSVIDLATMSKVGDVPLALTTTGKVSLGGATDTGANGIAVWPNPAPWQ